MTKLEEMAHAWLHARGREHADEAMSLTALLQSVADQARARVVDALDAAEAVVQDDEVDLSDVTSPAAAKTAQLELIAHLRDQLCADSEPAAAPAERPVCDQCGTVDDPDGILTQVDTCRSCAASAEVALGWAKEENAKLRAVADAARELVGGLTVGGRSRGLRDALAKLDGAK